MYLKIPIIFDPSYKFEKAEKVLVPTLERGKKSFRVIQMNGQW